MSPPRSCRTCALFWNPTIAFPGLPWHSLRISCILYCLIFAPREGGTDELALGQTGDMFRSLLLIQEVSYRCHPVNVAPAPNRRVHVVMETAVMAGAGHAKSRPLVKKGQTADTSRGMYWIGRQPYHRESHTRAAKQSVRKAFPPSVSLYISGVKIPASPVHLATPKKKKPNGDRIRKMPSQLPRIGSAWKIRIHTSFSTAPGTEY